MPIQMAHQLACEARRGPQEEDQGRRLAAPRRQDPGLGPLRGRPGHRHRGDRRLDPARRQGQAEDDRGSDPRARHQADRPGEADHQQDQDPRQPDRPLRHRWPARRRRPHRPQDHRRHVRRLRAPRRRRVLGQGSDEGRSLGRVLRALHREARRRGGPREALRGPVRVRDRRRRAGLDARRHVRHRHRLRREADQGRARDVRRAPRHADQGARPPPPDLQEDGRVRPLRPRGGRVHVGEDAARREAARPREVGQRPRRPNGNAAKATSKKSAGKAKASAVARA